MNAQRVSAQILGLGLFTAAATAQIGEPRPQVAFESFAKTEATSLEDFDGRLILIEVFAYW